MTQIPIYLFTGFLEAGKTKAIQETLEDERFSDGEKTLLLLCEEGIEEYDLSKIPGNSTYIEIIDSEEELTKQNLTKLSKKYRPDRVVLEYNGMWLLEKLYQALPAGWFIYQEIFMAECKTFESYNANMRSLVVDKLTSCELIVFNRPQLNTDRMKFHKIVRGITRQANIGYEMPDGTMEYDEIEDPLPFDINAPVINIEDRDYAIWFRDFTEEMPKYIGRTICTTTIVAVNKKLPKGTVVAGRHVMTCCIEDIAFKGLICILPENITLENKDWVKLTATIAYEYHPIYKKEGPVLYAISAEPTDKPEQEVATFY